MFIAEKAPVWLVIGSRSVSSVARACGLVFQQLAPQHVNVVSEGDV